MARTDAVTAVTGEIFREGWSKIRGSSQGLGQQHKQMARAALGHRAAVFKAIRTGGTKTRAELTNQLEYLTTKSSHIVDSRGVLDGKKQLNADEIKSVVNRFTERWDEGFNPKMGHTTHMLMSFPVGTRGRDVRDIASGVAERFFANDERNFDYLIAVHEDRAHPHAHIVLNRKSQEGEFFFLGRDHHFNYDDFRTAMVEEAEKYGVRLEATRRVHRGVTDYAPRMKEITAAKAEDRAPRQRERVGRDLDRALAEIANNEKIYRSLAAEASAENREDVANALFRASEMLARGGQLEQKGEIYMAENSSFDDLKSRFAESYQRVEAMIAQLPEPQQPAHQAKANEILRGVEHMQPLGIRSSTLSERPTDEGIYAEPNINRDAIERLREPETRAQIETALRGTGISSETVIARIETGATNAALQNRWGADDLSKIADHDGLNLNRRDDLDQAADKLDRVHVQLGEVLERAEVLRSSAVIETDQDDRIDLYQAIRQDHEGLSRVESSQYISSELQGLHERYFNQNLDRHASDRVGADALIKDVIESYPREMNEDTDIGDVADHYVREHFPNASHDRQVELTARIISSNDIRQGAYETFEQSEAIHRAGDPDYLGWQAEQAYDDHHDYAGPSHDYGERADHEDYLRQQSATARDARLAVVSENIRKDAAELEKSFDPNVLNYQYYDHDTPAREAAETAFRQSVQRFEEFASKSPIHAAMASDAWDRVGGNDTRERPDSYLSEFGREQAFKGSMNDAERVVEDTDAQTALREATIEQGVAREMARMKAEGFSTAAIGGRLMEIEERVTERVDQAEARGEALGSWDRLVEADQRDKLRDLDAEARVSGVREVSRVIEHERAGTIGSPFADEAAAAAYRRDIEWSLDDDQVAALKRGEADVLDKVIDDRLDRLYAAKAYLQSDEATANSDATREVISEITDHEYEAHRLKHVHGHTEKGQTHG